MRRRAALAAIVLVALIGTAAGLVAISLRATDCGRIEVSARPTQLEEAERARACLITADGERRSASLTYALATIEGDPIVTTVRLLPRGEKEVVRDATADRFGSRAVHRASCRAMQPVVWVGMPGLLLTSCAGDPELVQDGRVVVP